MKRNHFFRAMVYVSPLLLIGALFVFFPGCGRESAPEFSEDATSSSEEPSDRAITLLIPEATLPAPRASITTEAFSLSPDLFEQIGTPERIEEFFENLEVVFGQGAQMRYDQTLAELVVTNTPAQLLLVEAILDYYESLDTEDYQLEREAIQLLESRIKEIVIPEVNFDDTPLVEALRILSEASSEIASERIPISILEDPEIDAPSSDDEFGLSAEATDYRNTGITMRLTNVPLHEALRYTSSLAQLRYQVEADGILLASHGSHAPPTQTKAFRVPPHFSDLLKHQIESLNPVENPFSSLVEYSPPETLSELFQYSGISFPGNAAVQFIEESALLVARNDIDQLELIEYLISSVFEDAAPEWQSQRAQHVNRKLDSLSLQLSNSDERTLSDLTDIISDASKAKDLDPDIWSRGIPIYAVPPPNRSLDPFATPPTPLVNVSGLATIRHHLNRACRQAGYSYEVTASGVKAFPIRSEPSQLTEE